MQQVEAVVVLSVTAVGDDQSVLPSVRPSVRFWPQADDVAGVWLCGFCEDVNRKHAGKSPAVTPAMTLCCMQPQQYVQWLAFREAAGRLQLAFEQLQADCVLSSRALLQSIQLLRMQAVAIELAVPSWPVPQGMGPHRASEWMQECLARDGERARAKPKFGSDVRHVH